MLYKKLFLSLIFNFFFKSLIIVKSNEDNESYLTITVALSSYNDIIKLTVNQSGYHKIHNSDIKYILGVKINNNKNTKYSEKGIYYFPNNYNIVELNLKSQEKNLSNLFYSCSNITKINFTYFDFSSIELMDGLFNGCSSLTSIDFGNIKSDNVKNMSWMFNDCISLKELDLSKFNTKNVIDMQWMFHNCSSLTVLELSSFYTSSLENMEGMFSGDIKLLSLKLTNFYTSKVTKMNKMFEHCESLETLDLSPFNVYNVEDMSYMFNGCFRLNYIRFEDINFPETTKMKHMFTYISKSINVFINEPQNFAQNFFENNYNDKYNEKCLDCISDEPKKEECTMEAEIKGFIKCNNNFYYEENNTKYYCTRSQKIIPLDSSFVYLNKISCEKIDIYPEEDNSKEVECPEYFSLKNKNQFNYCIPECPEHLPFLLIYQAECVYNCTISERQNRRCITYYRENNFNAYDIIINQTKEELKNNLNKSVIDGNTINELNINISILSIDLNKINTIRVLKNIQRGLHGTNINLLKRDLNEIRDNYFINLTQCIEKLKDINDINDISDNLFLLRVDVEQDGMLFPNFFYELYQYFLNDNIDQIDLNECKNIKTIIDIYKAKLKDSIDKHNSSSDYYNDICYTTKSDYNTDIILSRRHHNYVDYNMSVCGLNCEFIIYNTEDNQAVCSCDVKTEIPLLKNLRFDKNILLNSFTKINNIMNVKMLKCYETVFNIKNIIKNIGFYIFLFFIILDIICIILFYYKDYKKILFEIEKVNSEKNFIINTSSNKNKNSKIPTDNHRKRRKRKKKQKFDIIKSLKSSETNKINLIDTSKNKIKEKNSKNENELLNSSQKGIKKNKNKNKLRNKLKKKEYLNHSQLNSLNYEEALNKDKRNYTQYYISLLLTNHSLIYIFYSNDYNSKIIKIVILIFKFSSDITINALFFTDSSMDKIYINHGSYNIIYQIPKIIYSSLISTAFNTIIKFLGLSESDILKIKLEKEKEKDKKEDSVIKVIKNLKIKFLIFFIINFLFQITFWYYVTCFCGVYKNTQIFLFKDSLFSFCVSLITPFAINLLPGVFRICGLKNKKEYVYNISKILQLL